MYYGLEYGKSFKSLYWLKLNFNLKIIINKMKIELNIIFNEVQQMKFGCNQAHRIDVVY
jgi:hypothetical protein